MRDTSANSSGDQCTGQVSRECEPSRRISGGSVTKRSRSRGEAEDRGWIAVELSSGEGTEKKWRRGRGPVGEAFLLLAC